MKSKEKTLNREACGMAEINEFICIIFHRSGDLTPAPAPIEHFSWIYQGAAMKPDEGTASLLEGALKLLGLAISAPGTSRTLDLCAFHGKE